LLEDWDKEKNGGHKLDEFIKSEKKVFTGNVIFVVISGLHQSMLLRHPSQ